MLDDDHVIRDMAIHDWGNALLRHPPPPLRLIRLTRHDPPLALARLRARDQLTAIHQQALRLTLAETTMRL